ncbi:MAG: hypothetical protein COV91_04970 [Candidatus Taylorbacteria bacterium CG11_big_fil_rev_8_21_14_0_20_46_11]|uniref:Uncharacterized protein n=1 Tax=Candidatus Taylorbacteria bacterium CG11_big_fil_rev_8_21_14_0_20_46_11 TaxID=1975025 RepID=A0A2H0KCH6_9BACT|nr:MAG: hypothetical protein COV91_04970 [Candidatus Taylorbacteria bacterium CG11_big_fil_rev_8_21_14_0_20_46_11]
MKTLYSDTIPAWFRLGLSSDQKALHVHISKMFIQSQKPIPSNAPIVEKAAKAFPDTLSIQFSGDLSCPTFGFGAHVRNLGDHSVQKDFVSLQVSLPCIRVNTGMVCRECNGTTERDGIPCLFCRGTGKDRVYNWTTAFEVVTNLWMLFMYLNISPEGDILTTVPQWMTLTLLAERGQHGSSLGGMLSKDAVEILSLITAAPRERARVEAKIRSSLLIAWEFMMGRHGCDCHSLRVELQETASLSLTVPGDASVVYTENGTHMDGRGCNISCHNMDNPAQSLSCLMAIASLSDELDNAWNQSGKTLYPANHCS